MLTHGLAGLAVIRLGRSGFGAATGTGIERCWGSMWVMGWMVPAPDSQPPHTTCLRLPPAETAPCPS
jgi:hypothetical protein